MFVRLILSAVLSIPLTAACAGLWAWAGLPPITSVFVLVWACLTFLGCIALKRQERI